jgi:hypothetical protein
MRARYLAIVAAITLVAAAGTGAAIRDDQSHENQNPGSDNPRCTGGAEASSVTADTSPAREATGGDDSPVPRERASVPVRVTIGEDEELVVGQCTGENWDGQDPNTRDSESDTTASEDGDVYVNPLGDCSGYDGQHPDGCEGGTDRPSLTEPVDARVTASSDSEATGDDANRATVYANVEGYGLVRLSPAANFDDEREGGYVALYGEDHTDQLFYGGDDCDGGDHAGLVGQFTGCLPILESFDGNVVCIPFDLIQGGQCGEGDCTQSRYQSDRPCPRDNTVLSTVEFGYSWAPVP